MTLRRSARLQHFLDFGSDPRGPESQESRPLPSPSTTDSFEAQHNRSLLKPKPSSIPTAAGEPLKNTGLNKSSARKRSASDLPVWRPKKKRRTGLTRTKTSLQLAACENIPKQSESTIPTDLHPSSVVRGGCVRSDCDPVEHWAATASWPPNFQSMSQERSVSPKKRERQSSYSQSTKDGEAPKAHTRAFEGYLAQHGIIMEEQKGMALVSEESKELCDDLLSLEYEELEYTQFPLSKFLSVLDRVRLRNEYRVFRDITPLLVPSAELLFMCGQADLEHVAEEVSADWVKSDTMGGPKPRPDLSLGISGSAFTEDEIAKLQNHMAWEKATLFTDNVYFPFLLCEAKSGDQGINRADRQNAQSSSMAVNAIIQLHRVLGMEHVLPLSGQILAFSVSHDNERVKLYGYFAVIEGSKERFYRYPVESFTLNFRKGQGRKRTSDFIRGVYQKVYPKHLTRIREALAKMDSPQVHSVISSISLEDAEPQGVEASVPSSQETGTFKLPEAPASKKQKNEMTVLREQMIQQERQNKEQIGLLERQISQQEKQYKEQMAQHEKQYKEQMAQHEKQYKEQMAQQEKLHKEQTGLLKELLDRR